MTNFRIDYIDFNPIKLKFVLITFYRKSTVFDVKKVNFCVLN